MLDLTRVLAGPTTGRTLASHGADVLLVNAPQLPNVLPFVVDTSHGKRSTLLDLGVAEDAARLRALARDADVFVNGYRSGALERHGFGPEDLAALRPGIVYVSVNCYGNQGPWAARPGWEQLAQTVTGIAVGDDPMARPALIPAAACDYTTGYLTALGVMGALHRRATEGGSWHVQTSLVQTAMWLNRLGRVLRPGRGERVRRHRRSARDFRQRLRPASSPSAGGRDVGDAAGMGAPDGSHRCASRRVAQPERVTRCGGAAQSPASLARTRSWNWRTPFSWRGLSTPMS